MSFGSESGRMLIRETPTSVVLTYLRDTTDTDEDNEAIVQVINKNTSGTSETNSILDKTEEEKNSDVVPGGRKFMGIYGEVDVNEARYLVYIKEAKEIGELNKKKVFEVVSGGCICIDGIKNQMVITLIDEFFKVSGLLFSDCSLSEIESSNNTDFMYNYIPLCKYKQRHSKAEGFGIEIVQGFFGTVSITERIPMKYSILSRRSWRNAGTRYYARGSDSSGHSANTVETIVFLETKGETKTYLQCRGSIPLSWEQRINLSYKPPVKMGDSNVSRYVFKKHFEVLKKRYRNIFFITLLDESGHEKELNKAYVDELIHNSVKYYAIDYHRMVKDPTAKKHFKQALKEILSHNYTIRTNCIDCLDRTNVVQSQLARIVAVSQLGLKEMSDTGDVLDIDEYLDEKDAKRIGQLWNNNGNTLSMQYTGTLALKNDLTVHGMRTFKGLIQDAISSGKRYVNNNFTDGRMQESIEIVTGVRNLTGNCYRGDRIIMILLLLSLFVTVILSLYSRYIGYTILILIAISFKPVLRAFLSFPSPLKTSAKNTSDKHKSFSSSQHKPIPPSDRKHSSKNHKQKIRSDKAIKQPTRETTANK
ncbi:phosphatidylinositol 4-phosphatase [Nematocida sp. AWRm80]|nr:phosphatidylinositol 4-phosphatase [Nematocida sp. AWRm80]